MGKKIRIGDIFNYINNKYDNCKFWFLLFVINFIIIGGLNSLLDNFNCETNSESDVTNSKFDETNSKIYINKCNDFVFFYETKILHSKEILMYLLIYHMIFTLGIFCSNSFFEFYKKNKQILDILNLFLYFITSFVNTEYIALFNINKSKLKANIHLSILHLINVDIFYLASEIISLSFIILLFFTILPTLGDFCYYLYVNKIANIEIIELPNDPISHMDKIV